MRNCQKYRKIGLRLENQGTLFNCGFQSTFSTNILIIYIRLVPLYFWTIYCKNYCKLPYQSCPKQKSSYVHVGKVPNVINQTKNCVCKFWFVYKRYFTFGTSACWLKTRICKATVVHQVDGTRGPSSVRMLKGGGF